MNSEEIQKLIDSNSNYWEKRLLDGKKRVVENEEDYYKRLKKYYDTANKQIEEKLAVTYQKYAKNNNLTLEQAYKQLPKDAEKAYKNDLLDYISKAKEDAVKYKDYLMNQSIMHKHSVLNQLQTEIKNVVYNIDMEETGGKFLAKIYEDSDYYFQYQEGQTETFAKLDPERLHNLLAQDWAGEGNFSSKIWKNKDMLAEALDDTLIKGLAKGQSYDQMAKALSERMGSSEKQAYRLIVTESARMDNQALLDQYKEMGVSKYQFLATLDNRTSEICRSMDGLIFNIEDAEIGLNVPPLHPYCRSRIVPYMEEGEEATERVYRDENNKSKIGKYKNYEQYLAENLGNKEQAKALASKRNDITTLVKAVGIYPTQTAPTAVQPTINAQTDTYKISNPNEKRILPREDRETLLTAKGPVINDINNKLANELEIDSKTQEKINKIDSALDKLPFYEGEVTTDIRQGNSNPLENKKVGDIWIPKKYLFSTKKDKYYDNTQYRFIIKSKTGRDVGSKVDNYKINKEVIFKRNSTFQIIDIKTKDSIKIYYLEQLI